MEHQLIKITQIKWAHAYQLIDDVSNIQTLEILQDKIASTGLDYRVVLWNHNLQLITQMQTQGYPLSMTRDNQKLIIGTGNGQLLFCNENLMVQQKITIAKQSISALLATETTIIALSLDGSVTVIDKTTKNIIKKIDLQFPLQQICLFSNHYYIAGVKSWKVSVDFQHVQMISRTNHFLVFKNQLFGICPTRGLYSYSRQFYSETPCDTIFIAKDKLFGLFDEGVSLYTIHDEGISVKSQKIPQFNPGYAFKSVRQISQNEFLGGSEDGRLFKLIVLT